MNRDMGHLFLITLGFFVGAALAVAIAPGDVLLWVAAGIVLALFCGAFLPRILTGTRSGR